MSSGWHDFVPAALTIVDLRTRDVLRVSQPVARLTLVNQREYLQTGQNFTPPENCPAGVN
jgi:hypothetical protein